MARWRTYKNGIHGHRYKGLYIINGKKGKYAIWDEDRTVVEENISDYDECEWIIDKKKASNEEKGIIDKLYDYEIYRLSALLVDMINKKGKGQWNQEDEQLYKWVTKIRKRKAEDRTK